MSASKVNSFLSPFHPLVSSNRLSCKPIDVWCVHNVSKQHCQSHNQNSKLHNISLLTRPYLLEQIGYLHLNKFSLVGTRFYSQSMPENLRYKGISFKHTIHGIYGDTLTGGDIPPIERCAGPSITPLPLLPRPRETTQPLHER